MSAIPEVHAKVSKLMLRAASPAAGENGEQLPRLQILGTIDDGYHPSDLGEQLWQCDVTLRPTSRQMLVGGAYPGMEVGGGGEIHVPARLLMRYVQRYGQESCLMVAGVAIGDPRLHPSMDGHYGIDEMLEGEVDIVPVKRWDGKEAFRGRADQVLTSWEFASPDGDEDGAHALPVLQEAPPRT